MTEREILAAEIALRLLEGDELAAASAQLAADHELAAMVRDWEQRLAPMAQALDPVEPSELTWRRILASLASAGTNDNDDATSGAEAARLRMRLRRWQWGGALAAAGALVLGVIAGPMVWNPRASQPTDQPAPQAPVLFASLSVGGPDGIPLGLTYLPESKDLLVMASKVPGDGVHDHELWLVVPDRKPISMGVVAPGQERRVHVSADVAQRIAAGLPVVLTREPLGGAPAGGTAGPVVAEGKFSQI